MITRNVMFLLSYAYPLLEPFITSFTVSTFFNDSYHYNL